MIRILTDSAADLTEQEQAQPGVYSGTLASSPLFGSHPTKFRLVTKNRDNRETTVAYVYGNSGQLTSFLGETLTISGDLTPAQEDRLTLEERNLLLKAGIATTVTDAGGNVTIERMVTNYLATSSGAADTSYQDVNTLLTLSYLRYDFRSRILRKYPRHKLAGDTETIAPGQAVMTPKIGRAEAVAAFQDWQELGLVEDMAKFKAGLVCERNAADVNRLDWLITPDLVNQFRVAAVQIQFRL